MNKTPYTKEELFRANVKLMEQIIKNFRKRIGGIRMKFKEAKKQLQHALDHQQTISIKKA